MTEPKETSRVISPVKFESPEAHSGRRLSFRWVWIVPPLLVVAAVLYFVLTAASIEIQVTPENATVQLRGAPVVPVANRFLLLPGEYELTVSAPGYQSYQRALTVHSGGDNREVIELAVLPGILAVAIEPSVPVKVSLNGAEMGSMQEVLLHNIPAGRHELSLTSELYQTWTEIIEIQGKGQTTQLEVVLEPNFGQLDIASNPASAQLYLDGLMLGETPLQVPIGAGSRTLVLSKEGFRSQNIEVEIAIGETTRLGDVVLRPLDSTLVLSSQPAGAAVTLNGAFVGETPLELEMEPGMNHQLRIFRAGYQPREANIELSVDERRAMQVELQPVMGRITVSTVPEDAWVRVNGRLVGSGSQQLALMSVPQRVEVGRDGFESQSRQVTPLPENPLHLSFSLLTEQDAVWRNIPAEYRAADGNLMRLFRDPGRTEMGSERTHTGRRANETRWTAELERAFYVASTQVTNDQFRQFAGDHSSGNFQGISLNGGTQPAVNLTWQQAALYANWLSEREGLTPFYTLVRGFVAGVDADATGYRLLTEAEWNWLAATTESGLPQKYSWGSDDTARPVENFAASETTGIIQFYLSDYSDSWRATAPVASFPPNQRGLYDLNGNASEWIHDWYSPQPYPLSSVQTDPLGPAEGEFHVIRGASWTRGYLPQLRLAYRDYGSVGRNDVGFRLARYAR